MSLRLSDHKVLHNNTSSLNFFLFHSDFRAFFAHTSYFKFLEFEELNKTILLFHSCLLDMRLVIANSALGASLAICHLISNELSWNNCCELYVN